MSKNLPESYKGHESNTDKASSQLYNDVQKDSSNVIREFVTQLNSTNSKQSLSHIFNEYQKESAHNPANLSEVKISANGSLEFFPPTTVKTQAAKESLGANKLVHSPEGTVAIHAANKSGSKVSSSTEKTAAAGPKSNKVEQTAAPASSQNQDSSTNFTDDSTTGTVENDVSDSGTATQDGTPIAGAGDPSAAAWANSMDKTYGSGTIDPTATTMTPNGSGGDFMYDSSGDFIGQTVVNPDGGAVESFDAGGNLIGTANLNGNGDINGQSASSDDGSRDNGWVNNGSNDSGSSG